MAGAGTLDPRREGGPGMSTALADVATALWREARLLDLKAERPCLLHLPFPTLE